MSNISFKNKKNSVSDADALKQKNFDEVVRRSKNIGGSSPIISTKWIIGGGAVLLTGVVLVIGFMLKSGNNNNGVSENTPLYEPLVDGVDIPYELFVIDNSRDTVLYSSKGTAITIPKNSLTDTTGVPLTDLVSIEFREFHDPIDVIFAGIPMTYDSAGTQYHFESAGMFEISGKSDNKPVCIAPDKNIIVDLVSEKDDSKFNQYFFDPETKSWEYIGHKQPQEFNSRKQNRGIDKLQDRNEDFQSKIEKEQVELTKLQNSEPEKPVLANENMKHISLNVNKDKFPELAMYDDVLFEIPETDNSFTAEDTKKNWHATLVLNEADSSYSIELKSFKNKIVIQNAKPVFAKENFEEAQEIYKKKYAEYQQKLQEKRASISAKTETLKKKLNELDSTRVSDNQRQFQQQQALMLAASGSDLVSRTFMLRGFGMFNCDYPQALPKGGVLAAQFVDSVADSLNFNRIYLVELDKKRMYTYFGSKITSISYSPISANLLIGVDSKNRLCIFRNDDFKKIKRSKDKDILVMKILSEQCKTPDELKTLLKLDS